MLALSALYPYYVSMYVTTVPNRKSPPAILLRESYRQDGKVKSRTLANLTHLPSQQIAALRSALVGSAVVPATPLPDAFRISRSLPHGHVAAVLGCLRNLELDSILDPAPGRQRDLVIAMIVARIIEPASKLATARGLHCDTLHHSLGDVLHLDSADETELYQAMDWLLPQQSRIEQALAKRHLSQGGLVLYDLTSTYFEGRHCPLAKLGHSDMVLIGDRGMITSARIREDFPASHGIQWISALRATQIQKLATGGQLQMSVFDQTDLVEIAHPNFPGERLIVCFNPLLAEERARKRPELLAATEKQLEKIAGATQRRKRPLRGKQNIGLRAGKILNRYKMGKHFQLRIEEDSFHYQRKTANIEREENLDGIYVIRTSVKKEVLSSQQVVASYKSLSGVERAFRSLKTVDLQVRPIHHRLPDRVRAHILLCGLAYYVEWHMRQLLAPILFDDDDKAQAQAARASIVAPALRSEAARRKAATRKTDDGLQVQSFQTLLSDP